MLLLPRLRLRLSHSLIPSDMRFDPQATPAAYVSDVTDEQPQRVTKDSEVTPPRQISSPWSFTALSHGAPSLPLFSIITRAARFSLLA